MSSLEQLGELDRQTRAAEFSCLVRHVMLARGRRQDALSIAKRHRVPSRILEVLERATIGSGGTDWGTEIQGFRVLADAFQAELRWSSAFYRLLPAMVRLPFNTIPGHIFGGSAGVVPPGAGIPVTAMNVLQSDQLERRKAAAIFAASRELLDSGVAIEGVLTRSLRALVTAAVDNAFVDTLKLAAPTSAATAAPETDLETMRAGVAPTDQSRLFWLTTPAVASLLSGLTASGAYRYPTVTWTGGTLKGLDLIVSDQVDAGELILVDASRVTANADPIAIDASEQALLEAVDDPAVGSPVGVSIGSTSLISTFQEDIRAVRILVYYGVEKIHFSAAYVLTGIGWTST